MVSGDDPSVPGRVASRSASSMKGALLRLPQMIGVSMPARVELGPQGGDEGAVLVVDRAATAEVVVVLADRLEPLVRDAPAGRDPAQEGHDLLGSLGTAEAEQEHGVVRLHGEGSGMVGRRCASGVMSPPSVGGGSRAGRLRSPAVRSGWSATGWGR